MIKDTLSRIESAIAKIEASDANNKKELVALLTKLKEEIAVLPPGRLAEAGSIARFTETAAHEVSRENANAQLKNLSISGIAYAVKGFEASHPKLVDVVNDICMMLSRIGI